MRLRNYLRLFFLIFLNPLAAQSSDAPFRIHEVTGGFRYEAGLGKTSYGIPSAPGWSANYSFRPLRWLALEAGLEQIPRPAGSSVCCQYLTNAHDQLYPTPFGARFIREFHSGRLSLSAGGGGAHLLHTFRAENPATGLTDTSAWGGQGSVSGRYAITGSKRFTVGATARYYYFKLNRYATDRIFTAGPDFTISF